MGERTNLIIKLFIPTNFRLKKAKHVLIRLNMIIRRKFFLNIDNEKTSIYCARMSKLFISVKSKKGVLKVLGG